MTGALVLEGVGLRQEGRVLLQGLDLAVAPGEAVALMGPSGSGKSTLLAHLAGMLPPAFRAEGRVRLGERVLDGVAPERRRLGLLFQDPLLFPHMDVAGNLAFALPRRHRGGARTRAVQDALAAVGLEGFGRRHPPSLSGGQRARAALVRALLAEPLALLLDEPFASLDRALRDETRALVLGRARAKGLPVLLVTHDEADAAAADRVLKPFA
ncbi:MAG: ATP-binding cassette domain-containing protein [Geminicoccaceae bacterium]|nr:ATP-binding cassette domain-containing protein [Geminicoccaceae bacterium]